MRCFLFIFGLGTLLLFSCHGNSTSGPEQSSMVFSSSSSQQGLSSSQSLPEVSAQELMKSHEKDQDYRIDSLNATRIEFQDTQVVVDGPGVLLTNGQIRITAGGSYFLSGTWNDGQVIVDSDDKQTVQIVMNGVQLHSSLSSPFYVYQAKKVVVFLAQGSQNILSDESTYLLPEGMDEPNATLFSKADLTLCGKGSLRIEASYEDGISSKDGLLIVGGSLEIIAPGDALRGKDYVVIQGGSLDLQGASKGIASHISKHPDQGYLWIHGGDIQIRKAFEGIEVSQMLMTGGALHVEASNDGVNVSDGANDEETEGYTNYLHRLIFSGGYLSVYSNGDGIDVNGSIVMTGGEMILHGSSSPHYGAVDYDRTFSISGGMLVASGNASVAKMPTTGSGQLAVMITLPLQTDDSQLDLRTDDNSDLLIFKGSKPYSSLLISDPRLKMDQTYHLLSGGFCTGVFQDGLCRDGKYQAGQSLADFQLETLYFRVDARL